MVRSIAVIGLGAMGLPMARNLLKAGFRVLGVDIDPRNVEALVAAGGIAMPTAAAAAQEADTLLIVVVNADQTEAVLFGDDGAVSSLAPSSLVIASTTASPDRVSAIAAHLAEHGIQMLDAPVSGGTKGAIAGTLTIMAAGADGAYAKAGPIFRALATQVFHIGPRAGQASTVKLINQLLCGVHLTATAEAVTLAEHAGVSPQVLYDVITKSSGTSRMFEDRAPAMWHTDPPKKAAVDIFLKDLGLVLELARSMQANLPLASAAHQVFGAASAAGLGPDADSEVVQVYRSPSP